MRQGAVEKRYKILSSYVGSDEKTHSARNKPEADSRSGKDFVVIEAYPGGAQDVLGIPRKQRGLDKLKAGLEKLGIKV